MKKKSTKCATKGCKKKRAKGRRLCNSCRMKKYAEENPLQYSYFNLRSNAKKRRKEFTITLDEFRVLCEQSGYLEGSGGGKMSLTIDRIINSIGYCKGNLRVITRSENSSKGTKDINPFTGEPCEEAPF